MISIPARFYSDAIWRTVRYRTKDVKLTGAWYELRRGVATISEYNALMLKRLTLMLKPRIVVEVGTYTGRSACAMAEGMDEGAIFTCDSEEDLFPHDSWGNVVIHKHKMRATQMFQRLVHKADFIFLDGRLAEEDAGHIQQLMTDETVIAFDDFEVIEKGVANAMLLQKLGGIIVVPEPGETLAMMIRKVGFARQ